MKKRHTITLKGYVARDANGWLFFYPHDKPNRHEGYWLGGALPENYYAAPDEPPVDISWEDEPREAIMTMHVDVEPK